MTDGPSPARPRQIAVVEDDDIIRGVMIEVLTDQGFEVTAASSGEEFCSTLDARALSLDALIVDVKLGGMDGFAVAQKARVSHPDLPVVFVSGDLRPLVRGSGRKDRCLMKPFTASALLKIVDAAC